MDANTLNTFQEIIMGTLGIGLSFVTLYIVFRTIQFKNKENIALIEKGLDASKLKAKDPNQGQTMVRYGIILISLAIGLLVGYILALLTPIPEVVSYSSMMLLFGGFSLIYSYKKNK